MKIQKTAEAKQLLKNLNELITEDSTTKEYIHTNEISNISRKLHSMKLKDEFFIEALTDEEQKIFDEALIIANSSRWVIGNF